MTIAVHRILKFSDIVTFCFIDLQLLIIWTLWLNVRPILCRVVISTEQVHCIQQTMIWFQIIFIIKLSVCDLHCRIKLCRNTQYTRILHIATTWITFSGGQYSVVTHYQWLRDLKSFSQSAKHDKSAKKPHENLLQFDTVSTGSAKTYDPQTAKMCNIWHIVLTYRCAVRKVRDTYS